jgi:hypothetical protein
MTTLIVHGRRRREETQSRSSSVIDDSPAALDSNDAPEVLEGTGNDGHEEDDAGENSVQVGYPDEEE